MQKLVQQAIDQLVESGAELGVQVAVYQHGELVVDAVAGVADPDSGRTVASGIPFYSASTGKGVTATVVHVLADRGALDYDTPIVELWPEFGAHGKSKATIRHALTHSIGVPAVPSDLTVPADTATSCEWTWSFAKARRSGVDHSEAPERQVCSRGTMWSIRQGVSGERYGAWPWTLLILATGPGAVRLHPAGAGLMAARTRPRRRGGAAGRTRGVVLRAGVGAVAG
ncbi:serine hydrolase domain-containing protein [Streptomyces atratus]|uniref:serine hydrolase domain-containing protein n=1 Tax=Streptomyces atratus TaxID=1893 RepID=UPI0026835A60